MLEGWDVLNYGRLESFKAFEPSGLPASYYKLSYELCAKSYFLNPVPWTLYLIPGFYYQLDGNDASFKASSTLTIMASLTIIFATSSEVNYDHNGSN